MCLTQIIDSNLHIIIIKNLFNKTIKSNFLCHQNQKIVTDISNNITNHNREITFHRETRIIGKLLKNTQMN